MFQVFNDLCIYVLQCLLIIFPSPCLQMNLSTNAHCSSLTSKENFPPSSKTDAPQVQRPKKRTVLGALSENEQRGRSLSQASERGPVEGIQTLWFSISPRRTLTFQVNVPVLSAHLSPQGSQFSKHSSISDSSRLTFLGCPSSSSYDVYVEEACEVVLAASGEEVVSGNYYQDDETAALQNEHLRRLLELSSSEFCK